MSEEINDDYWHSDAYKPLIAELLENCDEQEIRDIFEKIPINVPTVFVNNIMKLITVQTNHSKEILNGIYAKQYQINVINQLQEEELVIETIKYDDDIIEIRKNEIYLLLKRGRSVIYYKRIQIAGFGINMLYKAKDELKNIEYFTFTCSGELFYSYNVSDLLSIHKNELIKGNLGRDVIKKIFMEKSKTLPKRKAVYVNGFNNGWHIPIEHLKKDFMVICHTQDQRIVLNRVIKAYKIYTNNEKIQLCKILNKFIDITIFDPYLLAITAAWSIISMFRSYFIRYFKIFPHLGMEGDRETAKTAIMNAFCIDLWSIFEKHIAGNSVEEISRAELLASAGAFPIYIDELEVTSKAFVSMLKEMAGASSDHIRYYPDGTIRESVPKIAPIAMSSNTGFLRDIFGDLANNSKAIIQNTKEHIGKNKEWVRFSLKIKEGKYFSLLYDYTKNWIDKDLDKLVKEVEKKYNIDERIKKIGDDNFINKHYPRLKEIYTIILAGVLLWEKVFNIKLKTDKILKILVESRSYVLFELLNYFITFCIKAKDYFYSEIDSEGRTIKKNHPRYLNHELKVNNKGWGLFDVYNMEDFKQLTRINFKGLRDMCNQVIEGLNPENKNWLYIHNTSFKGHSIECIKVSPEILKYNIWDIEEPWKGLSLYTDEEMEAMDDEDIEIDFEDDIEIELLEVEGIEENDEDVSK